MSLDDGSSRATPALDTARVVANVCAIPVAIVLNYVGPAQSEVAVTARDEEPLLAAAGWAFSIWALIFAGQLGYAIYQAFPRQHVRPLHRRIGWLMVMNAVLGSLWLVAFTERLFTLAWLIMLGLLFVLAAMELAMRDDARRGRDYWLVRCPFGLNFGWISVATILNTTQWLAVEVGYDGAPLDPLVWSLTLVVVAAAIATAMVVVRSNTPFALATAWGLVAIAAYRREVEPLAITAHIAAVAVVAIAFAAYLLRRRRQRSPGPSPALIAAHGSRRASTPSVAAGPHL